MTAGEPIAMQAGTLYFAPTAVSFGAAFTEAPANDDVAKAMSLGPIPATAAAELGAATVEPGEVAPSCGPNLGRSAWYRFTAPGDSVTVSLDQGSYWFTLAAYSGSPASLTETDCRANGSPLTLRATPGSTIYINVWASDSAGSFSTNVHLDTAPDPVATFGSWPPDPASVDDISLFDLSSDPGGNGITSRSWDFGDGSTSTEAYPTHRYAVDGDYTVRYSITTTDGRSPSTSQGLSVRTHDVGIARFMVPSTAKAAQKKTITIGIGNRRYPENVTVQLYAIRSSGDELIGSSTLDVAVLGANQATDVSFTYTFTKADATAGKVTFRAVVSLNSGRDALPSDNQAISLATKVSR